ncbi:MAG: RNA 2',3'-cyclic phosphodiesterase [Nanoarchaeota archaeon]
MRCFIGIFLPKEMQGMLENIQKQIGREYAKTKWVLPEQIHITLKFLGEVDDKEIEIIKEALLGVHFRKFQISLDRIGWFPNDERINVIWVGFRPEKDVLNLHGEIEIKLGSLFDKDERFAVHATLGRVKYVKNKEKFLKALKNTKGAWEDFFVESFSLVKSDLSKDGPEYSVLKTYDLW